MCVSHITRQQANNSSFSSLQYHIGTKLPPDHSEFSPYLEGWILFFLCRIHESPRNPFIQTFAQKQEREIVRQVPLALLLHKINEETRAYSKRLKGREGRIMFLYRIRGLAVKIRIKVTSKNKAKTKVFLNCEL